MLRPSEWRAIGIGLALIVVLGLGLGYAVGRFMLPDLSPPGPGDVATFAGAAQGGQPAQGIPGYADVYVNDTADLLDGAAEAGIRRDLIDLYDATGIEMTVLTITSRADHGYFGTNEAFATRLFNTWGIGNAQSNDGVLVLVSLLDREMRIELGAGWSRARDADMQQVIDDVFLPAFRQNAYQSGIVDGVTATIRSLTGLSPGAHDQPTVIRGLMGIWTMIAGLAPGFYAALLVPLAWGARWVRRYVRQRPRPCRTCGDMLVLMGEEVDDAHLDGGQRLEEFVKSVDYDVWECPSCTRMEIRRHAAWFTQYGTCPKCNYRTLSSETEILRAATTSSTGTKRIDYACENCGHTDSETRTIPKRSKSSSGSGRSSFGGGRSSGGGASGSW